MRNQIEHIESKTNKLMFLLALALIVITSIVIARYSVNSLIPGQTPYYHMKIAKYLNENILFNHEPVSNQLYIFDSYDYIISLGSKIASLNIVSIALPLIINILLILFLYLTFNNLFGDEKAVFYGLIALIISPIYIYTSLVSSSLTYYLLIIIIIMYLLLHNSTLSYFAAVLSSLIIVFSPNVFIVLSFFAFLVSFYLSRKTNKTLFLIFFSSVLAVLYQSAMLVKFGLPQILPYYQQNMLTSFISNLGAVLGFGIFYTLLAPIGLILTWREKKRHFGFFITLISLSILSFLYHDIIIFLNLQICYLAALAFNKIILMKWKLNLIKNLTIIVIIIGLSFSILTFTVRIVNLGPTPEVVKALTFLQDKSEGKVLSSQNYGLWIQYFAEKGTVIDTNPSYLQNNTQLINQSYEAFNSFTLQKTKPILNDLNVSYILITGEMKSGLVWTEPNVGLLFLLQDNETFKSIYSTKDVEIWKYLKNTTN